LVITLFRNIPNAARLFKRMYRLHYNLFAYGCWANIGAAALKDQDAKIFFQFLNGKTECRLAHKALFSRTPKISCFGNRDYKA
jgi:hypothetical protein